MTKTVERVELIDAELRQAYIDFTDKFVVTEESLPGLRSAGGLSKPPPIPENIEVEEVATEDGVTGLVYRPVDIAARSTASIVWFHGGGFIFGRPGIHQALYIRFVEQLGVTVFAPAYRLAPEHVFPAAHNDAYKAWQWFTSTGTTKYGLDSSKVALGGTSAGGGLAFGVALRARDQNDLAPAALLGNIPFFSAEHGQSLKNPALEKCWGRHNTEMAKAWYTPAGTADPNSYAWIYNHPSFHKLPPTLIGVAELDTLRDAAIGVATRILAEGDSGCELHVWRGAFHGSVALVPKAKASIAQDMTMVSFLQRTLGL